jgi:hypothetical protein
VVIQKVHSPIIFWRQNNQLVSKSWLSSRQHKKSTFNNWLFLHINFLESFAGQNSINAQIQLLFFLASTIKRLILLGSLFLPAPQKQMAKAHTQLYLGYTKPIWDNVKYWHGSKIRVLCFKTSHILVVFLKESRERCSITSRTPYSGFRLLFFIFITRKIVMIGFITKLMSLTQQTDGKCNEENCQQNLCLHKEVMILFYTLLGVLITS